MRNHLILLAGILMFSLASCTEDFEDNDLVGAWEVQKSEMVWTVDGETERRSDDWEPLEWVFLFDRDGNCYSYSFYNSSEEELEMSGKWKIAASTLLLYEGSAYENCTINTLNSSKLVLLQSYEEDGAVINTRLTLRKLSAAELD